MSGEIYNPNPVVFAASERAAWQSRSRSGKSLWIDEDSDQSDDESNEVEPIDRDEVFELIRFILDPEHPNTLEELHVVSAPQVEVSDNHVTVEFTPTVPHCGMSTLIGLSIRVRLLRSLPQRFKVDIRVKPGSHASEESLNKQLNDKERVAAALENLALVDALEKTFERVSLRRSPPK